MRAPAKYAAIGWTGLEQYLATDDGRRLYVDAYIVGELVDYDADELLTDYGIPVDEGTRRRLARVLEREAG
jgi:hypothetical protein